MAKKTTKKTKVINGQLVEQRIEDLKFLRDWQTWKGTAAQYGFDFLEAHGVNGRAGSTFNISQGHQSQIIKLDDILEFDDIIGEKELTFLKKYAKFIEDSRATIYDPAKIKFHEKVYNKKGEVVRRVPVWGHWATKKFTERNPKYGGAVDASWYTYDANGVAKNPPHLAIYSESSTKYSKPKGLLSILEDGILEIEKLQSTVRIRKVGRAGDLLKLPQVRAYLDSLMTGTYFKEGMIQGRAIANAIKGERFEIDNEQQEEIIRRYANLPESELVGDITHFFLETTPAVVEQMYMASKKRKAGGYYIHGKKMDKRPRKDGEIVAKADWKTLLREAKI